MRSRCAWRRRSTLSSAALERRYTVQPRSIFVEQAREAVRDAYKRLISPAIERELREARTEEADESAIEVFGANLRSLLLQPPVRGWVVMGVDPGFRTGCKVTVVDATSRFLEGMTIYPHEPQKRWEEAKAILTHLVVKHGVSAIAIGNGTASRETESLVAEVIGELPLDKCIGRPVRDGQRGRGLGLLGQRTGR